MDICLGNDNAYISILIKRATLNNSPTILTDSQIANTILDRCNKDINNLTYSLCNNNETNKNILFTRRVNIYSDINANNGTKRKFANKLYAVYDSNKIECTTKIIDN